MSTTDPRPPLSAKNSARLEQALVISDGLQRPATDAETRLTELKSLLDHCRKGIRRQNPNDGQQRLAALDQARNYLYFLPDMQRADASGRLKSVSRRLRRAMQA